MRTVSVFAAILDEETETIVCVQRASGSRAWTLPGGGVKRGETHGEALVREVTEETGLVVRIGHLIGVYVTGRKQSVAFVFRAVVRETRVWTPTSEIAPGRRLCQERSACTAQRARPHVDRRCLCRLHGDCAYRQA